MSYQQPAYPAYPQPGQPESAYQTPIAQPEPAYQQQPQMAQQAQGYQPQPAATYQQQQSTYQQPQPIYQQPAQPGYDMQQQQVYYPPQAQLQPAYAPAPQDQPIYAPQPQPAPTAQAQTLDPAYEQLYKRLTTSTPPPVSTFTDLCKAAPALIPASVKDKPISSGNPDVAWLDICPFCTSRWSILPDGSLVCEGTERHMISQAAITEWETTGVMPWMQGTDAQQAAAPMKKQKQEKKTPAPSLKEHRGKKRKTFSEHCKEVEEDEPRGVVERDMYGLPYENDGEEDYEDYAYCGNQGGGNMGRYGRGAGGGYEGGHGGHCGADPG